MEMTVIDGCFVMGVPSYYSTEITDITVVRVAHQSHNYIEVSKMKSLARSYIWWPQIYSEIYTVANGCESCLLTANSPQLYHCIPGWFLSSLGNVCTLGK